MKLKNLFISGALAASALGAGSAMAVPTFGTAGGSGNDFASTTTVAAGNAWGGLNVIEGMYENAVSVASLGGGSWAKFHVEVFGGEAGYTNTFAFGSDSYTHTTQNDLSFNPVKEWDVVVNGGGLLGFSFAVAQNGIPVLNGLNNPNVGGNVNFFTSYGSAGGFRLPDLQLPGLLNPLNGVTPSSGNYVWLFLDDGGGFKANGLSDDDNHDDLIVRISYVPEPATLGLLGLGLVGLGALRRRKTA